MNLHEIATNPPVQINAKFLKGRTLAEVMEENPLLPNYTLLIKWKKSGDDQIVSSAHYARRGDGQSAIETKEVPATFAEPTEKNTYINFEKRMSFRSFRKMYGGLPPKPKARIERLLQFACEQMQIELSRAGKRND